SRSLMTGGDDWIRPLRAATRLCISGSITMVEWYDYFQIATLILITLLTTGRAIHMRMTQHINPITLGKDKKGVHKTAEFGLFLALVLCAVVVVSCALHVEEKFLPTYATRQLFDWQFVKLIGAGLLTLSL